MLLRRKYKEKKRRCGTIKGLKALADLDLQIRGGGGHLDPDIRWGPGLKKNFFGPSDLSLVHK